MPSPTPVQDRFPIMARAIPEAAPARGFWVVAAAFALLMAFGTLPTPLWPLFAERDDFGSTVVTIAFATMVAGAAVGFLLFGHLSDRLGRKRVAIPALLTSVVASLTLVLWTSIAGLLVGRVLTGLAVGLMASTATVYLSDLYYLAHPDRPGSSTPGLVAAAANLGGLALGPLAAGVLAQWAPYPLITPFVSFGATALVLAALVLCSPETISRTASAVTPARFALQPGGGRRFAAAAGTGFFSFAVMGFFSSLGAVVVRDVLHISSPLVAGLAPFTVFAASAAAQIALRHLTPVRMLVIGVVLFPTGLALTATALYHPALWLYLTAAAIAGAGAGLLFKASVGQAAAAARPASRAGVLALFFVVAYLGMGLPSIAFSVVAQHLGLNPSMICFAIGLSVGALAAVTISARLSARTSG
ncbi:MFS transporter [Streptomyces microflavus]|uniref:MFS transporter n=1 Tax=Streptomyces microflavus TaxID=1919 RepID=UPI0037FC2AF7